MIKVVDIRAELAGRPVLRGRSVDTPADDAKAAFVVLAPFRDGSIFAGSFSGETPWERHQKGDELVHILEGAATLTVMTDNGPELHAAAERFHAIQGAIGQLDELEGPGHRTVECAGGQTVERAEEAQVVAGGELLIQG